MDDFDYVCQINASPTGQENTPIEMPLKHHSFDIKCSMLLLQFDFPAWVQDAAGGHHIRC